MNKVIGLMIMVVALLMTSCASKKKIVLPSESKMDSIVYREKITTVKDTVYVDIPLIEKETVTRDTISRLENSYAVSIARVDTTGLLYHMLKTIPQKVSAETETQIITRDSIVYREREVKIPYPVEAELTVWQKIKTNAFTALLILFLIESAVLLIKRRK